MTFGNKLEIGEQCFEIFLTQDAFPELSLHQIHMAGIAHLKPPYVIERSDPPIHTVLFTSSGYGKLVTKSGELAIGPETMTVIPAHHGSRFEIASEKWDMCWIILLDSMHWHSLMPDRPVVKPTQQALNVFHLSHVIDQERSLDSRFRQHSFEQFARYLEYNLESHSDVSEDRLGKAFAHIEQSLHKPWRIEDIAALTYYSEPHLYRLCKQRFGKSPKQLVRDLKTERAKQLLTHTDWSLSELAQRLGFSDQFNFSNRFKKDVGISPSEFRHQHSTQRVE